jgi:spindle assembly abnormal protein 6
MELSTTMNQDQNLSAMMNSSHGLSLSHSSNLNPNLNAAFTLKLDTSSGIFSIVESNQFKQLTHIYLQLRPGNDSIIKSYLAARLFFISCKAKRLDERLEKTKRSLDEEEALRKELETELIDLKKFRENELHTLEIKHNEEITKLKFEYNEVQHVMKVNFDMELTQQREAFQSMKESCNDRINGLEQELLGE